MSSVDVVKQNQRRWFLSVIAADPDSVNITPLRLTNKSFPRSRSNRYNHS